MEILKKYIILVLVALCAISCEPYCPQCGYYGHCGCSNYNYQVNYGGDNFYAEKLLGTWQCSHNTVVGDINIKEIEFINQYKCDIIYSVSNQTTYRTKTYSYTYVNNYIKFSDGFDTFMFHIEGYLFPELYLRDSFNKYTWRKVKSHGC